MEMPPIARRGDLAQIEEDFSREQLFAKLRVEALAVATLPWVARLDVACLHADPTEPLQMPPGTTVYAD